eukprot:COSAG05_NODE_8879_length_665_cov_0.720848_1_plen_127_part_10
MDYGQPMLAHGRNNASVLAKRPREQIMPASTDCSYGLQSPTSRRRFSLLPHMPCAPEPRTPLHTKKNEAAPSPVWSTESHQSGHAASHLSDTTPQLRAKHEALTAALAGAALDTASEISSASCPIQA